MNYKNNTPFKLKGSPFKQTGKTDPNYNEGQSPKIPEGGLKGDEYKLNERNDGIISVAPSVETKNVDLQTSGNTINDSGNITRTIESQQGTITSAGDKLIKGSKLPTYREAWDKDIDGIRTGKGYGGIFENYLKDMGQIQKGDARDIQREKARKIAALDKIVPGEKTADLDTNQQKGELGVYDYGTKQSSYESRKNIRTTKQSSNTTKNRSISNARLDWKDTAKNEDGSKTIDGKKYNSRSDFMKSKKIAAKRQKNNEIMKTSKSETLNSQNASDQNIGLGGKVRGNKRNVTSYDSAETIKGAQNSMDLALSGGVNTISQQINRNKNIGKGSGFKMGGYGSKNKNK
jgi:hypothetical protein